jgi:hypothetical protein
LATTYESIRFQHDVLDVGDEVVPEEDELPSIGSNVLVLGLGHLEEGIAICDAALAHDVLVSVCRPHSQ